MCEIANSWEQWDDNGQVKSRLARSIMVSSLDEDSAKGRRISLKRISTDFN